MKRLINQLVGVAFVTTSLLVAVTVSAGGETTPGNNPSGKVYFLSPQNGDVVTNPVVVRFGLSGMGVAPAGVDRTNTGHHHLLIDLEQLPDMTTSIPSDENHRHFGGGQTEVVLELAPGEHSLQLLLGDFAHRPHNPPILSEKIKIQVK